MLWGFSFVSYLLRMNISVAQQYMVPELRLSDVQIGAIFSTFMLGYSLFQVPAGVCGDRFGPRLVLTAAAVSWGLATFLTGLIPGLFIKGALAAFVFLLIVRFGLGIGEAATYPVAARAVANWMPASEHAFSNAMVIVGATLGSAFTPPLIAYVMQAFGWRATFYLTTFFPFAIAILWWWQATDRPEGHRAVSRRELAVIIAGRRRDGETRGPHWWAQLRNRNIAFLCASYFLYSYVMFIFVFWLFKYLVDVRKFSVVGGGWATSLPFVVASVALPSFGYLSDRLSARMGILWGRRAVAMGCLVCAGLLLFAGAGASRLWVALAAISLSVGCLFSTEGPYWSTAIEMAGPHAGAAGGLMNMAGNLGGVVSTMAVPLLVRFLGWFGMFASACALTIVGAAFWLLIRERATRQDPTASQQAARPSLAV
jgi:ACS family glucarate transporter-like MFS transporter